MANRVQGGSDAAVRALMGGGMTTAAAALQRLPRQRRIELLMPGRVSR